MIHKFFIDSCDDPFENHFLDPSPKIMSCSLNRINSVLFTICFVRFVNNWFDSLFPKEKKPNLLYRILAAVFSIVFCVFLGYPLLLLVSFFFTCKYYPYVVSFCLSYFMSPWVLAGLYSMYRKEFAFTLKSSQNLPEQISEIDDTTRPINMPYVQQADRMQQPWQILQRSAQQESRMFDISPEHLISEQLSSGSSDMSITEYRNRMIELDSEDLSSLLIPLHFSTEPLEDVPRLVTYAGSNSIKTNIDNSTHSRKKRRRKRPMGFRRPKMRKKRATSNPTDSLPQQKKI